MACTIASAVEPPLPASNLGDSELLVWRRNSIAFGSRLAMLEGRRGAACASLTLTPTLPDRLPFAGVQLGSAAVVDPARIVEGDRTRRDVRAELFLALAEL